MFGDPGRSFDLSEDMVPGDLAHYQKRAEERDGGTIRDHAVALPFVLLPVLFASEDGEADLVRDAGYHYHFEERSALLLWLLNSHEVGKFDQEGRNLSWDYRHSVLFGLLTNSTRASRRDADGGSRQTSEYRLLLGFYGLERDGPASRHRLLWFITFGDDID
jgi:hypothetical protein